MADAALLAWAPAVALAMPAIVLIAECLAGLAEDKAVAAADPPPFAVLVPAHDEALGIAATIAAARAQLRPCDRLIVVADNCTDATAALAAAAGAEVVERVDAVRRGKGFALAAGREALFADPPAAVIVLDADCLPEAGALPLLAAAATTGEGAVVQGAYLLSADAGGGALAGVSTFAFLVKNLVRQRGLRTFGALALLQGTGMAFPWRIFATAPLASAEIVEDLELGLRLSLAGVPVRFLEAARVWSKASPQPAMASQRTRWEHGSLAVAWRHVPRLAGAAARGRIGLALLMLDLTVPPLALLVMAMLAVVLGEGAYAMGSGHAGPLLWTAANLGALAATILLVWHRAGRRVLPGRVLMRVPAYLLWKLPIYARLLGRRQRLWVRTDRA